jgi:hypothetical protein
MKRDDCPYEGPVSAFGLYDRLSAAAWQVMVIYNEFLPCFMAPPVCLLVRDEGHFMTDNDPRIN